MDTPWLEIAPRERPVGSGTVQRLLPYRSRRMVGPFIFADLIGPESLDAGAGIDIDAHPHIGLSTLSYLFAGRMVHRDSTGAVATIEPGAVNWMTAGGGVCHTERSHPDDRDGVVPHHGIQTWVALDDAAEDGEPSFTHRPADAIPAIAVGDATVRIPAGTGWGETSPVPVSSPLVLAEVRLGPDDPVRLADLPGDVAVLNVGATPVRVGGRELAPAHLAVVDDDRPELSGAGHVMVLGGEPLDRRYIWWNFVHSDPERIEAAKADWTAQRFPRVPDDHDPWIPLPGS